MPEEPLPPYIAVDEIARRLSRIFPEGSANRTYCVREMAARTVFAMLYVGAIKGSQRWLAPKHVYRMTKEQASLDTVEARIGYAQQAMKSGYQTVGTRWYADNTREPIRDETLREGFVSVGAALTRTDLPTTSSKPRYALQADFAALFDPQLGGESLDTAISNWQAANLSQGAQMRIRLRRRGADTSGDDVLVTFPNGETRRLAPGPSSQISRAVIEEFAPRFLDQPFVLWLSESGNKVAARDDALATEIGLTIEADKDLPDIILVDLGPNEPLLLFVEVVATDGPVNERRRRALLAISEAAGLDVEHVAFLSAFADRDCAAFKKTVNTLAWGSLAWFASEPDKLMILQDKRLKLDRIQRFS